ncbi:MAG: transporter substrate-binding domain-containing protein [Clostridia bacterium]|nr:transporter substrate-binding domain-containing protein [Clostridia bacterium]
MSNLRKTTIIIVIMIMAVMLLAACAGAGGSNGSDNAGKGNNSREKQEIVIGSDSFEPYFYQNSYGEFEGIDIDLAKEALGRMGYDPVFKMIGWDDKDEYLKDGKIDCLWGCYSMNGRENKYQWAGPYMNSRQVVCVRKNINIKGLKDLRDKTVAVQETGKAEEYFLRKRKGDSSVPDILRLYAFVSMDEVDAALRKNYVDAIAGHENALNSLVETAPEEYEIIDEPLFLSKIGVAFGRNYDSDFVRQLNRTLNDMQADGTVKRIVEKYGLKY